MFYNFLTGRNKKAEKYLGFFAFILR